MDRLAPRRRTRRCRAWQRPLPDAEIDDAEVSLRSPEISCPRIFPECSPAVGIGAAVEQTGLRHVLLAARGRSYITRTRTRRGECDGSFWPLAPSGAQPNPRMLTLSSVRPSGHVGKTVMP